MKSIGASRTTWRWEILKAGGGEKLIVSHEMPVLVKIEYLIIELHSENENES